MNRLKFFSVASLILIIILMPMILWYAKTDDFLNVAIIDKTVPNTEYREHEGLVWILNNEKLFNPNSQRPYSYENDYYGFFPSRNETYKTSTYEGSKLPLDLVYITDTYGVYDSDFFKKNISGERSKLIYGGIDSTEIDTVRKAVYDNATVVAEFNTFASPTSIAQREELYDLLGLQWSGWIGRYFRDLRIGGEIPDWAVENYEKTYNTKWNFRDDGLVFVNENDQIVVLDSPSLLNKGVNFKFNNEGAAFFGKSVDVKYDYWFDIIVPENTSSVLASYNIGITSEAEKVLEAHNIPTEFPAVIRQQNSQYLSYYFAGDYSDYPAVPKFYKLNNWSSLMEKLPLPRSDNFFWKAYVPMMKKIFNEASEKSGFSSTASNLENSIFTDNNINLVSRTNKNMIQIYKDGKWEDMFIKGVNLGIALPGKWFTDFPKQEKIYLDWFDSIGTMNANTIRVYTLMDPSFYRALLKYNDTHPDKKLWLLQEVWPEEHPLENNYLREDYTTAFYKEIEYAIDAIHGNLSLPERRGRAYGNYYADVSKYTLGFLVGRELEPEEVSATNKLNSYTEFKGEYIQALNASPTEVWLAKSCDHLLRYQSEKYAWQHPVAIVSWPTLDPLSHDSEWNKEGIPEYNDKKSININHFELGEKTKSGFFGAYHIYPNYPDFMNNTLEYREYTDEQGILNYGGYLKEFIEYHTKYPALVAEFGLATGMGNAHHNPDGYHHGSMTEKQQGDGIVRMMKAIDRESYAGGLIFEWMDEWAKKTWTTEPFMIPYENHVFWHNAMDPEQNYGILAAESKKPETSQMSISGQNIFKKAEFSADASYVYIDLETKTPLDLNKEQLTIGLDTYAPEKGSIKYDSTLPLKSPTGMEFLIKFKNGNAEILTIPEYNISRYSFASKLGSKGPFEKIMPITNKARITKDGTPIKEIRNDNSRLNKGAFNESFYHWNQNGNMLHIRLPWTVLNITDPTSYQVLDDSGKYSDYPPRDTLKTSKTDGIRFSFVLSQSGNIYDTLPNDLTVSPAPFLWTTWGEPEYSWRLKESYFIIQDYFKNN